MCSLILKWIFNTQKKNNFEKRRVHFNVKIPRLRKNTLFYREKLTYSQRSMLTHANVYCSVSAYMHKPFNIGTPI